MGEFAEDLPSGQSDSDASSSNLDSGESSGTLGSKCRWMGCGLWFGHLDLLASHVTRVHAECGQGGLFYCGWEGCARGSRGFNARYKMLVHVRTHTNEKPHQCFQCEKSFSRAENLKIHARSHTGERPYVCPVLGCGKAYSNSSDRFKHTRTHSVDKPYVCKVPGCSKKYTDPSSLRKHVKTYRHYRNASQDNSESKDIFSNESHESLNATQPNYVQLEEERKDHLMETSEESMSYPKVVRDSSPCFTSKFLEDGERTVDLKQAVHTTPYSLVTSQFHQWPRPEYSIFCSWLSMWNKPTLLSDPEQDSPLDLTVHHGS